MSWIEYGAYAGIIGGILYFFLLFAFRSSFTGRNRISWVIQLEMAVFILILGFMTWKVQSGGSSVYLGTIGWIWLALVIITVIIGFIWR